jgi:hypothetical protein
MNHNNSPLLQVSYLWSFRHRPSAVPLLINFNLAMKVLITRLSKGILSHKLSSDVPRREVEWYRNNYWKMVSCPISHAGKLGNPIHDSGMSGMSIKSRVTWPGHICQNVSKATLWDLSVHLLYVHTKTLWNTEILYFATLMCENLGKAHVFQHTLTNKEETHKKNTHNTYSETFAPPTWSQTSLEKWFYLDQPFSTSFEMIKP